MLHNLDTIYFKPDLVRISQPKLISVRTFFWFTEVLLVAKRSLVTTSQNTKHILRVTHNDQHEPPLPYPQRLRPLPPWVDQRCHQRMAPPLPMVACTALGTRFGGTMVGLFALAATCHHIKKLSDTPVSGLSLGGCHLIKKHNNQPTIGGRGRGDV